jgi:hypothetical protein
MPATDLCVQCGQTDDHPKLHYAKAGEETKTYHFDCLPFLVLQDVTHVTDHQFDPIEQRFRIAGRQEISRDDLHPHNAWILKVREQANKGKHGDELRDWITKNGPKAEEN